MRNQNTNPMFINKKQYLAESGRYPQEHVDIFWNYAGESRLVKEVEVVFVPRVALTDDKIQRAYGLYVNNWTGDLGNSCAGWLSDDGYTPEDIFGHLLNYGFASKAETLRALEEFAHIDECEWARRMLRGFKDE